MAAAAVAGDDGPTFRAVRKTGGAVEGGLAATRGRIAFQSSAGDAIAMDSIRRIDAIQPSAVYAARNPLRRVRLAGGDLITAELTRCDGRGAALRLFDRTDVVAPHACLAGLSVLPRERDVLACDFTASQRIPPLWEPPQERMVPQPLPPDAGGGLPVSGPWLLSTTIPAPFDRGRAAIAFRAPHPDATNPAGPLAVELRFDNPVNPALPKRLTLVIEPSRISVSGLPGRDGDEWFEARMGAGRHQATVLFDPAATRVLLDGAVIASSRLGIGGLQRIELQSGSPPAAAPLVLEGVQAQQLVASESAAIPARRPTGQDRLTLTDGTEFFGSIGRIDGNTIAFTVVGRRVLIAWRDVSQAAFALPKAPTPGDAIVGCITRIELAPPADHLPWPVDAPPDSLVASIVGTTSDGLAIQHPWLGEFTLPVSAVRRIEPRFEGTLLPLDDDAHPLGKARKGFEPPIVEGRPLGGTFSLDKVPERGRVFLSVEVSDVEPCGPATPPGSPFLAELRAGFLRTEAFLNDVRVGDLNSQLTYRTSPSGRQRVRLSVPREALKPGANHWSLRQRPDRKGKTFDDCEVGPLAIEIITGIEN